MGGGGSFNEEKYWKSRKERHDAGVDDFAYSDDVRSGRASGIHPSLDPKTVAGPKSALAGCNVNGCCYRQGED